MATNPYVNKVEYGGTTLIDITDTTAEDADVAEGKVYYKASGLRSVGTASGGGGGSDPYPVRDDGNAHLWVLVDDPSLPVTIYWRSRATNKIISWGDGDETTITGTAATIYTHEYSTAGLKEIIINTGTSSNANFLNASNCVMGPITNKANIIRLKAIEFPATSTANSYGMIRQYFFQQCIGLEKITWFGGKGYISVQGYSLSNPALNDTIPVFVLPLLSSVTLGKVVGTAIDTVGVNINPNAFNSCPYLRVIESPVHINSLGSNAFKGCTSLVSIPELAGTSISASAFEDCWSMPGLKIPANCGTIHERAFANCYSMREIHFLPATPPAVDDANAWENLPTDCVIYVPTGTLADYQAAANYPNPATYTYVEE